MNGIILLLYPHGSLPGTVIRVQGGITLSRYTRPDVRSDAGVAVAVGVLVGVAVFVDVAVTVGVDVLVAVAVAV